jgi:hypothetical protein
MDISGVWLTLKKNSGTKTDYSQHLQMYCWEKTKLGYT